MKLVKKIVEQIDDELYGAKKYMKCANEYKQEYPSIANMYYEMSIVKMNNVDKLHNAVVSLINEMKSRGVEVDDKMMVIYNYEHERAIDKATKVKIMQEMYKK